MFELNLIKQISFVRSKIYLKVENIKVVDLEKIPSFKEQNAQNTRLLSLTGWLPKQDLI